MVLFEYQTFPINNTALVFLCGVGEFLFILWSKLIYLIKILLQVDGVPYSIMLVIDCYKKSISSCYLIVYK